MPPNLMQPKTGSPSSTKERDRATLGLYVAHMAPMGAMRPASSFT